MSNSVSHSIFHQTLLCQAVSEYQSKAGSSNSLFQAWNANKGSYPPKKLLLSTNFRGNRLCARKRKLAMGKLRHQAVIPRAVLTTNPSSQLSGKFNLEGNVELQVGVSSPAAEGATVVDIQVSSSSGSLVLHWGVICDGQGKWVLPSRRPDGTKNYKNRALRTPFVKSGSASFLKIEIDEPAAQAIEFLILDESQNKWYKNNGENFHIKLGVKDKILQQVSVPEDLVQVQAYLRWERKGKQLYTPEQEKEEYEAARTELVEEIARGTSIEDMRTRLTNESAKSEIKEQPHSETKSKIPDELVQVQAYIRWEKAGKPNYTPDQQLREFEEARKDLQTELEKGLSLDEIRKKMIKGEIQVKVSKQQKSRRYFGVERIQRKKRDLMQLLHRHVTEWTEKKTPIPIKKNRADSS